MRTSGTVAVVLALGAGFAGAGTPPTFVPTIEVENFDGSRWVVTFDAPGLPVPSLLDFGRLMAEAARSAYENQTSRNGDPNAPCFDHENPKPNWGYESGDADCVLRITIYDDWPLPFVNLQHPTSPGSGFDVNIQVSLLIKEQLNARLNYLGPGHDLDAVARSLIPHEHFYNLALTLSPEAPPWPSWIRGMSRVSQTLMAPDVEYDRTGLFLDDDGSGVNFLMHHPHGSLCASPPTNLLGSLSPATPGIFGYPFALFWGHLAAHDGGPATLRAVTARLNGAEPGTVEACNRHIPRAVTEALAERAAANSVAHATFEEAWVDFALRLYTRDFTWGATHGGPAYEWGRLLDEVARTDQDANAEEPTRHHEVGAWGLNYTRLPGEGEYEVSLNVGADAAWVARLLLRDAEGLVTVQALAPGATATVRGDDHVEVVFNAVRLAPTPAGFDLTVLPV